MKSFDLTGLIFGKLTVIKENNFDNDNRLRWLCSCSCGNVLTVKSNSLISGNTKSCGCIQKNKLSERNKTHGLSKTKLYTIWCNMKSRCDNEGNDFYQNYGGRGIMYQPSWKNFEGFYSDMSELYEDGMSLERLNVNGNYSKENCTWITLGGQAKNRRKPKNNTSGFTGVDVYTNSSGTVYYRARWSEGNKNCVKYFSTKKYENAYEDACLFRVNKIKELGYGDYHGV